MKRSPDATEREAVKRAGETPATSAVDDTRSLAQLIEIGIAVTSEPNLAVLLERIVTEARRFTGAEAGTLYLRDGDTLRFAVVQNDWIARRYGERQMKWRLSDTPLTIDRQSVAGFVADTGQVVNLVDANETAAAAPFEFNWRLDTRTNYRTRSLLVVPLQDPTGTVLGVLHLTNALAPDGKPLAFDARHERLVRALASQASVAIRNAQLEDLSYKDGLTDVFNGRYLRRRLEEEALGHETVHRPLSFVIVDLDRFQTVNERFGHRIGDQVLREVAQLLMNQAQTATTVTRYGGDEFGILLVGTPKPSALTYAQRMKGVIERYPFTHGPVTVTCGVATMPDDAATADGLITAADRALHEAKRVGRKPVGAV